MITAIGWIVGVFYLLLVTWIFYVAIMSIKDKLPTLPLPSRVCGYIALWTLGYPLDLAANIIVSAFVFQRWPMRPLLTGTLKYWIASDSARRAKHAGYICRDLLHPFDSDHCK